MKLAGYFLLSFILICACQQSDEEEMDIEISESELRDKINGGVIGQFFGNLNGLEHENKYNEEPGNVHEYIPDLSDGARTDDDTDIEFMYIHHMLEYDQILLPYDTIYNLWIENLSTMIWCSNEYARKVMNLGIKPPYTGRILFNPWAVFNISGQFLCEQFALISPGMPQTAGKIGTHYTHVAVDGEPIQTTQLFDAMIASAFFEDDIMAVIDAGLRSVDPASEIHYIVSNVIEWYHQNPQDWRATRLAIKEKYWNGEFGGPGGSNGYRVITAATIGSLLYGQGDFVESIRHGFNYGWDADNITAMIGTIIGVIKGEKWIREQGWIIKDLYINDRRPGLPTQMTIGEFAEMHLDLAKTNIISNGGELFERDGENFYRIKIEKPSVVEEIPDPVHRHEELLTEFKPAVLEGLRGDSTSQAAAVYLAVCLGIAGEVEQDMMEEWGKAISSFMPYYKQLFEHGMWSQEARDYFKAVVINGKSAAESPLIP
jgi:hypothetical protein